MNKKSNNYKLNVQGIKFWVRIINNNGEEEYVKGSIIENYYLYIQRIKDDMYIDYITNRVFTIKEEGDYIVIYPSGIKIPKERMTRCNNIMSKYMQIIDNSEYNKEDEYYRISEGIILDSYFCNELAFANNIDSVPANYVDEAMTYIEINYGDTVDKGRRLVQ